MLHLGFMGLAAAAELMWLCGVEQWSVVLVWPLYPGMRKTVNPGNVASPRFVAGTLKFISGGIVRALATGRERYYRVYYLILGRFEKRAHLSERSLS